MNLFLDANVLVAVLNKEYPVYGFASRILSLAGNSKYKFYTSPLCLAIAFYFAEKKSGHAHARAKIEVLTGRIHFTGIDEATVQAVINNKMIHDIEDGLQYYSAIDSGCTCIISEDKNDFYFSEIEVLTSRVFLENYIF